MKHIVPSVILCLLTPLFIHAQQVSRDNWQSLQVVFTPQELNYGEASINGQQFTTVTLDGYLPSAAEGLPCLPTFSQLIEVPLCKGFEVQVTESAYDTIQLPGARLMPTQPSCSKSDTTPQPLIINEKLYATDAFYGQEEALVKPVGIARDRSLARLQFSPVRYNPVRGQLIVCRHAVVTVRFLEADKNASIALFDLHHSPAFSIGNGVLNNLYPKSVSSAAPIRYLIVAHSSFHGQLENFVQWKRRKGYLTDIVYTDTPGVGTTTTSISSYIQSQYTNATPSNPAPTYLLIVGDHEQIPAFTGTTSSEHITDLYYISWTPGDNIPDCYCGRFSAQNVSQLTPQIEKTLMYEQYTFADPSFLDRAVLVAGVDGGNAGDHGYTHADPAMDYAAIHYINSTQGFTQVHYFKNNTSIVPSAPGVTIGSSASSNSAIVRGYYNQGAGWINYSAHGSATSWGTPSFTTTHISSMTNTQKFGLMIGNCCLTNKFETTTCFGEALLRKDNYCGAVGYIGGSNSTYWNEDFYWAVGLRSGISATMSLAYNAANLGAYDRLCHTHSEPYSQWAFTQGAVMMAGNMAVESSTSSRKLYYWEIYHLMGDPSVMTYLTQASVMPVTATSVLAMGTTTLSVSAVPYAYVALTDTLTRTLVASAFADSTGNAVLSLPTTLPVGGYELAASAQQYRTAFTPVSVIRPSGAYPVVGSVVALLPMDAGDTIPLAFTLVNLGDSTASSITFSATPSDSAALTLFPLDNPIDSLPAGDTVVVIRQAIVGQDVTDGIVLPLATATLCSERTIPNTATYYLILNAPDIVFNIQIGDENILPGTSDTLIATLVNQGHATLNPCRLQVSSPTSLLALGTCTSDTGNVSPNAGAILNSQFSILNSLLPGDTVQCSFPLHADSLLPMGIVVPITLTLTQLSINTIYPLYIEANPLETFEGGVYHSNGWTQGTYPWTTTNTEAYAGSYCLRSTSALTHNQTAEISIPVTLSAPDSITFYFKVSSETNYDKFHFYLDNDNLVTESGEIDWTRAAFLVPAGSHLLKFTYAKDYSVSRNDDCAWIDNIALPHQSHPVVFRTDDLCVGSQYVISGDTINTAESGTGTYISADGSSPTDTVRLIDYIIHPTYNTIDSLVACDSLTWHDSTYTASTSNSQLSILNSFGCDSTVTLHLTIHPSYAAEETITGCDTLFWNETFFTTTTDTTEHLTTVNGCDSIMHHHLVVNHSVLDSIFDTTTAATYVWNDSVYTSSGTYIQVFSTQQGCDSIVMLQLTIINGDHQDILVPDNCYQQRLSVKAYPNPTTGQFTIGADDVLSVFVFDNSGHCVTKFFNANQFNLSQLPAGTYLLYIKLKDSYTICRIIKQ
ncbi:MAG: T9SS type A sorting domain-containing protein [Bacteroidales bacterium]|nr:T9SS type A sorting domain-containing protein [Bacteroidales bacterium]